MEQGVSSSSVRARLRFVSVGGLFVAASIVACGFDSSGSGSGASLSVGEEDGGPSGDDVGDDDDGDDATADGSAEQDGSSDSQVGECGDGGTCGDAAPQGWTGPFALAAASPPDATLVCPQGWTEQARGGQGLNAVAATCGCNCAAGGGTCSVSVSYYSDSSCTQLVETAVSDGSCANLDTSSAHGYAIATGTATGMSCTPSPTSTVPPIGWTTGVALCAPPPADACDDGPCLPAPPSGFDGRWCVMAEGEQACPAGAYSQASVVHRNAVDSRSCSPCTCDAPASAVCPGAVDVYFLVACAFGFEAGNLAANGACGQAPYDGTDDFWSLAYDGTPPTYACGGPGVAPIGEATPSEPFTMCCTP